MSKESKMKEVYIKVSFTDGVKTENKKLNKFFKKLVKKHNKKEIALLTYAALFPISTKVEEQIDTSFIFYIKNKNEVKDSIKYLLEYYF
jgi:hypothetical protein